MAQVSLRFFYVADENQVAPSKWY